MRERDSAIGRNRTCIRTPGISEVWLVESNYGVTWSEHDGIVLLHLLLLPVEIDYR